MLLFSLFLIKHQMLMKSKADDFEIITSAEQNQKNLENEELILSKAPNSLYKDDQTKVTVDRRFIHSDSNYLFGKGKESDGNQFYLTYSDQEGVLHYKEPLVVSYQHFSLKDNEYDNWTAILPSDINRSVGKATLEVEGRSNFKQSFDLYFNNWWEIDYSTGTLIIHPHELNWDQDSERYKDGFVWQAGWPWTSELIAANSPITNVIIEDGVTVAHNTSLHKLFYSSNLKSIVGSEKLNTGSVSDFSYMFGGYQGTSLNLSNFNTENVLNMRSMFYNCNKLTSIDVSRFDTRKVTSMEFMFGNCKKLESLDVTNFDTSSVNSMAFMFNYCYSLTSIDVSRFDTRKVTEMAFMFNGCNNLESLDVSRFDTGKVTNMKYMFNNCNKLESLDVSRFDTGKVTSMASMFSNCAKLESLDVTNFDTSKVTDMASMFDSCLKITELNLTNFDTRNIEGPNKVVNINSFFRNMESLWKLTIGPKMIIYRNKDSWSSSFPTPVPKTKINDLSDPNGNFYARDDKWQEVGTGTPHDPKGSIKTASEIINDCQLERTDVKVYVWYQTGRLDLIVPSSINFGVNKLLSESKIIESSEGNITVTDSRNFRSSKPWQLNVRATNLNDISNPSRNISDDLLYIRTPDGNHHITNTNTVVYHETSQDVNYQDTWNKTFKLLFKVNLSSIPGSGTYQGKVIFTLVTATP